MDSCDVAHVNPVQGVLPSMNDLSSRIVDMGLVASHVRFKPNVVHSCGLTLSHFSAQPMARAFFYSFFFLIFFSSSSFFAFSERRAQPELGARVRQSSGPAAGRGFGQGRPFEATGKLHRVTEVPQRRLGSSLPVNCCACKQHSEDASMEVEVAEEPLSCIVFPCERCRLFCLLRDGS